MLMGTDDLSHGYWVCSWVLMIFLMGIGYAHGYLGVLKKEEWGSRLIGHS